MDLGELSGLDDDLRIWVSRRGVVGKAGSPTPSGLLAAEL